MYTVVAYLCYLKTTTLTMSVMRRKKKRMQY